MLPLSLFRVREFSAVNALTLAVYFALSGAAFLAVLQLQIGLGWTPLAAGAALLPVTLLILGLSPVAARLSTRIGAWPLLTAGPLAARRASSSSHGSRRVPATSATSSPVSPRWERGSGSPWRR